MDIRTWFSVLSNIVINCHLEVEVKFKEKFSCALQKESYCVHPLTGYILYSKFSIQK